MAGDRDEEDGVGRSGRPVEVTRVVGLALLLLVVAAAMTVLAVVLDDRIVRDYLGSTADSARSAPSFAPVVVVLYVVVAALVLVLLAFLAGGHGWARHCLGVAFVLLGVSACALVAVGPLTPFVVLGLVWVGLDVLLLVLMYRPGMGDLVAPRPPGTPAVRPRP